MRKYFIQFPSIEELEKLSAAESSRPVIQEKEEVHYVSLQPIITFLNKLGINTSEITTDKTWQQLRVISEDIFNQVVPLILSADKEIISTPAKELYEYLSEEDTPQKSDLIFVFGAKTPARAEKAVELYKAGLAPKIVFSGGHPHWDKTPPEAETYKQIAIKAGIPEKDIITEPNSISLDDNVKTSLNLLDKQEVPYQRVILVNSPYAQRRGYSHLLKFSPPETQVYRVNCTTKAGLRSNDWFTNEEGIRYVLSEYYKLWFGLVLNNN